MKLDGVDIKDPFSVGGGGKGRLAARPVGDCAVGELGRSPGCNACGFGSGRMDLVGEAGGGALRSCVPKYQSYDKLKL